MPFVYENEVSDGFAEVRFFPAPEHGPPTSMEFEVTVLDGSDEFRGNMKNSDDRIYTQLAEELEEVVANELGGRLALTRSNYTGTFSGSVEL